MILGGLQPCSFSDYPEKTAAVVFTQGCNFRCPFCHNGSLLSRKQQGRLDEQEFFVYLLKRRKLLDGVVVTGGEPTIQPDLPEFIRNIKSFGVSVKLDTNGSNPQMLAQLLEEELPDYIAMDVKAPFAKYETLCGVQVETEQIRQSIKIIASSGVAHHFRTTEVTSLLLADDIKQLRGLIPPGSKYLLQPFVADTALQSGL